MLVPSARAKESLPSHLFSSLHFRVILLCKWGVISCELKLLLNPWLPLGDHALHKNISFWREKGFWEKLFWWICCLHVFIPSFALISPWESSKYKDTLPFFFFQNFCASFQCKTFSRSISMFRTYHKIYRLVFLWNCSCFTLEKIYNNSLLDSLWDEVKLRVIYDMQGNCPTIFRLTFSFHLPLNFLFPFPLSKIFSFSRISLNLSQKKNDLRLIYRWIVVKFEHQVWNSFMNILIVGN